MIWNKGIEQASEKTIKRLQLERLNNTLSHVYNKTPFYKERLDEAGVRPGKLESLKDMERVPLTTKEDLRLNYPYKLFAVPMKDIVRIHASSGTTGKPTVVGYTRNDLDMWSECMARLITMAGGSDEDIAQICFGYGLFTGALGLHAGLEKIGAAIIPISAGNTERQLMVMEDFGTTLVVGTPSYALYMSETAAETGVDLRKLPVRTGLFGGEGHTLEMNREIEKRWGITATENYGLSEIIGPGVSGECVYKTVLHFNDDCFYPEIIDPETLEPVQPGQHGELVFTTLTKEGMPMIRYRTRDLTSLHYEPCPCGRTAVRMNRILGRSDDMLIIRGVNVFPSQVESVILELPEFEPYYLIIVDRVDNVDTIQIQVELRQDYYSDEMNKMLALRKKITSHLQSVLGLKPDVKIVEPRSIERSQGKAKHVIDNRKL